MGNIKSEAGVAQSVASGIMTGAGSISDVGQAHPDEQSRYSGNDIAKDKIMSESNYGEMLSNVLQRFIHLIHTTAAEFVGEDQHLAHEIEKSSSTAQATSRGVRNPNFVPDRSLFKE